jgi:hypothetical protein
MRGKSPHTNRRGGALRLAAVEGGLMAGTITARPQDYFALLVGAGIVALFSALVATLCIKFEERGVAWFWAALFFGSALVAAYCLGKLL